jgi:protein-tyrosine phosphatase
MSSAIHYVPRNLRDLGGYRGCYGLVRTGVLYRSAQLDDLGEKDTHRLAKLGLTLAVDLRDASERQQTTIRLGASLSGLDLRHMPLLDAMTAERMTVILGELKALRTAKAARDWMNRQYEDTVSRCQPRVLGVVDTLMRHDGASIFFCAAGKDRTGIVAALLYLALGVPERLILKDYLKTNRMVLGIPFWRRRSRGAKQQYDLQGVPNCVVDALADAHPGFLAVIFAEVVRRGGIVNYLCDDGVVSQSSVEQFRKRMIAVNADFQVSNTGHKSIMQA